MKKEEFTMHAAAIIKGYDELINIWQAVLTVAKEMDGKVFNKRFTEAVNNRAQAFGRVHVSDPYNTGKKEMTAYIETRFYKTLSGSYNYIDDVLCSKTIYNINYILKDGGRISAENTANVVNDLVTACVTSSDKYKDAVKNWDKYEKTIKGALSAFGEAMKGVNSLFVPHALNCWDWEKAESYNIYKK